MLDVRTGKIKLAGKYYKARFRPIEEIELKTIEKKTRHDGEPFSGRYLYTIVKHADGEYYMQYLNGKVLNINIDGKVMQVSTLINDLGSVPAVLLIAEINEKDTTTRKLIRETTTISNESNLFKYNIKRAFKTDGSKMKILCQICIKAEKLKKYLNMHSDVLAKIVTKQDVEQLIDKISMLTNMPATWIDKNDSSIDFKDR